MLKPIPTFQNYFIDSNKNLFGLSENGLTKIELKKDDDTEIKPMDFFSKSGDLFLSVDESETIDGEMIESIGYYKQSGGVVTSIQQLPTKPAISRSQLLNSEFSIENFDYQGKMCSDVKNLVESTPSGIERFFMVNGFAYFPEKGLFFNVADGRYNEIHRVREKGLYYWPSNRSAVDMVHAEDGEIW